MTEFVLLVPGIGRTGANLGTSVRLSLHIGKEFPFQKVPADETSTRAPKGGRSTLDVGAERNQMGLVTDDNGTIELLEGSVRQQAPEL